MRKWLALLGVVVIALALAVGVRTLTLPSRQIAATPAKPVAVDAAVVSARLAAATRLKTIASATDVGANAEMIQFYHQLIGNASSADTSQDRSLP